MPKTDDNYHHSILACLMEAIEQLGRAAEMMGPEHDQEVVLNTHLGVRNIHRALDFESMECTDQELVDAGYQLSTSVVQSIKDKYLLNRLWPVA